MISTEYISWVFAPESVSATVGLVTVLFVLVCALGGLFGGFRRGIFRQLLHTVTIAASFFAALTVTKTALAEVAKEIGAKSAEEIASELLSRGVIDETLAGIIGNVENEVIASLIALLFAAVIASLVFVVVYLAIAFVMNIIYFIASRFIPKHKKLGTRIPAMLIGLVEGAVAAALVLTPAAALIDTADAAISAMEDEGETDSELYAFLKENVEPHKDSPVLLVTRLCGGDAINAQLTEASMAIDETTDDPGREIGVGIAIYATVTDLGETNWQALTPADKDAIGRIIDLASESELYSTIVSGLLHTVALSVEEGYINIEAEAPFDQFVTDIINIFIGMTPDTLGEDLDTLKNLYFLLSDRGVLEAITDSGDAVTAALIKTNSEGVTVINEAIAILKEGSPRIQAIITTLTKLSVSVIAGNLGLDEEAHELYENVKESLNTVLSEIPKEDDFATPGEYKDAVATEINSALAENDIELEDEIVDGIADYYVNSGLDEYDELTDENINDIILSYYDAYLKMQNGDSDPQ